jgi:hypothetical protein
VFCKRELLRAIASGRSAAAFLEFSPPREDRALSVHSVQSSGACPPSPMSLCSDGRHLEAFLGKCCPTKCLKGTGELQPLGSPELSEGFLLRPSSPSPQWQGLWPSSSLYPVCSVSWWSWTNLLQGQKLEKEGWWWLFCAWAMGLSSVDPNELT